MVQASYNAETSAESDLFCIVGVPVENPNFRNVCLFPIVAHTDPQAWNEPLDTLSFSCLPKGQFTINCN